MRVVLSDLGPWELLTSHLLENDDTVEYTYTKFFDTRHGGDRDPILDFKKTDIASVILSFINDECLSECALSKKILDNFQKTPTEGEILDYLLELMYDNQRNLDVFDLSLFDAGSGICTIEFELKGKTTVEKIRKSRPENVNLLDIFVTTKVCYIQAIPENLSEKKHE
jgi:hypothetical protein